MVYAPVSPPEAVKLTVLVVLMLPGDGVVLVACGVPVLFAPVVELVVPLPPQAVKSSISPSIAIQMRQ